MSFFSDIKDKVTGKIAEKVEDNKEKTAQQGFEALKNMFLLTPVFRLEHYYMHLNVRPLVSAYLFTGMIPIRCVRFVLRHSTQSTPSFFYSSYMQPPIFTARKATDRVVEG